MICSENSQSISLFEIINIKDYSKNKNLERIRGRLIGTQGKALKTLTDLTSYDNVVVARTFSKAFGLANLRIGYAITNEYLIEHLSKVHGPFPVSRLSIVAAISALKDLDYMKRIVQNIINEREKVYNSLMKISYVKPIKSYTNFILFWSKISDLDDKLLKKGV